MTGDPLSGDLSGFDPRRDLDALLTAVRAAGDRPLSPLADALAASHPLVLADLACGPRSPGGSRVVRAALPHVEVLERALSPRGLYPRLAELAGEAAPEVLDVAARRHPAAAWLLPLSRRVEGPRAGVTHLLAARAHPAFAQGCRSHAEAGHREGLVAAAALTGRPEPAAALLAHDVDAALRAAAAALDARPDTPVPAHLAAEWGPEPDLLFARLVPLLRSRAAAESLRGACAHQPRTRQLLDAVIPGMARAPSVPARPRPEPGSG